jgi:hypothetical protein
MYRLLVVGLNDGTADSTGDEPDPTQYIKMQPPLRLIICCIVVAVLFIVCARLINLSHRISNGYTLQSITLAN